MSHIERMAQVCFLTLARHTETPTLDTPAPHITNGGDLMRTLFALVLSLPLLAGCDGFTSAAVSSEAFIQTPVDGDTLHVAAGSRPAPEEDRLLWTSSLPLDAGAHRMVVEISPSPTFDPSVPHSYSSTRYETRQRIYAKYAPRPDNEAGAPTLYYWRVRVAGGAGEEGPWSEPGSFVVVADSPAVEE